MQTGSQWTRNSEKLRSSDQFKPETWKLYVSYQTKPITLNTCCFVVGFNALLIRNSWETEHAIKENIGLFTRAILSFKYRIKMFGIWIEQIVKDSLNMM